MNFKDVKNNQKLPRQIKNNASATHKILKLGSLQTVPCCGAQLRQVDLSLLITCYEVINTRAVAAAALLAASRSSDWAPALRGASATEGHPQIQRRRSTSRGRENRILKTG